MAVPDHPGVACVMFVCVYCMCVVLRVCVVFHVCVCVCVWERCVRCIQLVQECLLCVL